MSRRAKRITIALFSILFVIPVVYLALSWRPPDALEFQASAFWPDPSSAGTTNSKGTIDVLIANKGHFPIRFYYGYLEREDDASPSSAILQHTEPAKDRYVTIPPGKFVRGKAGIWDSKGEKNGGIHSTGIKVRYYWLSAPGASMNDWLDRWHQKRNPERSWHPEVHESTAPLIPPPNSATVE
jgi:hypothetical protein